MWRAVILISISFVTSCLSPQKNIDAKQAKRKKQTATAGAHYAGQDKATQTPGVKDSTVQVASLYDYDETFTPTQSDVDRWVLEHKDKGGGQGSYGYLNIPLNMYHDKEQKNLARIGIFKALNHTSPLSDIYNGEDISDGKGIVFAIDTAKIWGSRGRENWQLIAQPLEERSSQNGGLLDFIFNSFNNRFNDVKSKTDIISVDNMQLKNVDPNQSIEGARFVYNITFPNVYNQLIGTPGGATSLARKEGVGQELVALSAQKNAIVNGPRVSAFWQTNDGRYYITTADYFANFEGSDIPYLEGNPVPNVRRNSKIVDLPGGTSTVSEAYIQGKNSCPQYFIWGAGTQERGRAETVFVVDPQNHYDRGQYLVTGRSCISCHINGAQAAPSDMPDHIESGRVAAGYKDAATRAWTSNDKLNDIYRKISGDFREKCMGPIVRGVSDAGSEFNAKTINGAGKEPVLFMIRQIERAR
jgi:hypothetical protein